MRHAVPMLLLLAASTHRPVLAQRSVDEVVWTAPRADRCMVGTWRLDVPEVSTVGQPLSVSLVGRTSLLPVSFLLRMSGPGGAVRRELSYDPTRDEPRPICDSAGPRRCAPHDAPPETSIGVSFAARHLAVPGRYRLRAREALGGTGCTVTVHVVEPAAAAAYAAHQPVRSSALALPLEHRLRSWAVVRTALTPEGPRLTASRASFEGSSGDPVEVDILPVPPELLATHLAEPDFRLVTYRAVARTDEDAALAADEDGVVVTDRAARLPAIFYEQPLLHLRRTEAGFEVIWAVSEARMPGGAVVRIRGVTLEELEGGLIGAYLGTAAPSLPPALP